MRKDDMRVAPLAVLYLHKNHYDHHRKKIDSIHRKKPGRMASEGECFERMELVRQNLQKFEQRQHTRSLELARQNEKIVKKLENVKSFINFKKNTPQAIPAPVSRVSINRSKSFFQ
jgi:predicted metallo-beta-lactamase superfamily hydrolase